MPIQLNFITVFLGIIISQAFFAAVILWFSKNNKVSNRFLAVLLLTISLWLFDSFLRLAGIYNQKPNWYFMPIFYSFAFGPLIYFYVKSLTIHPFEFKKLDFLHFIPVAIQAGLYLFLNFQPYAYKNWFWQNIHQPYTYRVEFDGTWISILIYLLLSIRLINHYQKWLVDNFSELSKIKLNWLKAILGILLILSFQWMIEIVLRDFYNLYFNYDYSIQILGVFSLLLAIGGIRQSNLSEKGFKHEITEVSFKTNTEIDLIILEKIKSEMENGKYYLNPTLNLAEFAKEIKVNSKLVSKHINAGFNKSFNDFVNEYRVEEVKRRLKTADKERYTLLSIALESGFNSKTTFNRIFKDFTGVAPREFEE